MNTVTIDTKSLDKIVKGLSYFGKEMPGAAASAVNRTLDYVNTQVKRTVTAEYAIKQTDVTACATKKKASKSNLSAGITYKGRLLSLAHFPHNPSVPGTGRYIKVKIKKSEGYKTLGPSQGRGRKGKKGERQSVPWPFVGPTGAKSADKVQANVFQRTGKSRFPIKVLKTLSVPQMITNTNVEEKIQAQAAAKLQERVNHEIKYRLDKIKGN